MVTCADLLAGELMPLHPDVTYGPLRSRRLGNSLGVNLLPPNRKICSFNCLYCQYGWTDPRGDEAASAWPDVHHVARRVSDALEAVAASATRLDRITLAGHGEPTLHPEFETIVERLRSVRDLVAPGTRIAVLSNASTLRRPHVGRALTRLDERYMKLDAGDADTLRRVNATAVDLEDLLERLASLPDFTVQTMLVTDADGLIDNTTPGAVGAWLDALARVRPVGVHLYTLARAPALGRLRPAPRSRMYDIRVAVERLGIPALVFE
jgi:wyosine [tRNA(Phe)-imidazoG37] synthetase (radical SAM superfamily)